MDILVVHRGYVLCSFILDFNSYYVGHNQYFFVYRIFLDRAHCLSKGSEKYREAEMLYAIQSCEFRTFPSFRFRVDSYSWFEPPGLANFLITILAIVDAIRGVYSHRKPPLIAGR